jgi:hypothetical protein
MIYLAVGGCLPSFFCSFFLFSAKFWKKRLGSCEIENNRYLCGELSSELSYIAKLIVVLRGVETPPFLLDFGAALLLGGCKKSHNRQRHNELQEREYKIATFIAAFFVDAWNGPGRLSVLFSFHSIAFLFLQIFLYLLLRCCSER